MKKKSDWGEPIKEWKCPRCGGLSQDAINASLSLLSRQARQEGIGEAIEKIAEMKPVKRGKWVIHSDWISRTELVSKLK